MEEGEFEGRFFIEVDEQTFDWLTITSEKLNETSKAFKYDKGDVVGLLININYGDAAALP